jgi:small subunit ribosomal protein S9
MSDNSKKRAIDNVINAEILAYAIGRRKRAVARVRMYPGIGKIIINGKPLEKYVYFESKVREFLKPLEIAGVKENHDFTVKVSGGGASGQLDAIKHGIARCIAKINDDMKKTMRQHGFLTRDPREKERKKVYRVGARKSPQYSKR